MLVIKAATTQMHLPFHSVTGYCDNMGVVIHCADPHRALVEKQSQVDVLALLLKLMRELPPTMTTSYKHVKGHLDKHLREDQLSLEQRENVTADKLAKAALMAGVETENYINSCFPFESITMSVGGRKVTRSPKYELYSWWGYRTARDLFHNRHIVQKQHFGLIFWKGVERAMKKFPKMFRTWITKHVSHFCGTNLQLSRFDYGHSNECPSCGDKNESSKHINRCTESGRTDMFHHSIRDLQAWMEAHHTDDELSTIIVKYLTGRGNKSMTECLTFPSSYTLLAEYQDKLGWDNFLEGRILSLMVEEQRIHIKSCSTVYTVESWATGMIEHLLGITHKQWVYRNARVHLEKLDGHTEAEHAKIMSRIRVLLWTDPDSLMPRDRLLLEGDFSALGSGPAANRLYWIASMESALGAAAHERRRSRTISIQNTTPPTTLRTADIAPVVDSEGSIKYRRCRRRK
jgi:hypothetical protein